MYAVQRIYEVAGEASAPPAMIYDLNPISYAAFYRMIMRMRRALAAHGLKPGGVAVTWIYSLQLAWTVELALRSLGVTTLAIREPGDLANLGGLDIVAVITAAPEGRGAALDPEAFPAAQRIAVEPPGLDIEDDTLELPPTTTPGDHILLTSGTTGRSKMVLVEAAAEASNVRSAVERQKTLGLGGGGPRGMINLLNFGLWTAAGYASPPAVWGVGASVIFHQGPEAWRSMFVPRITSATLTPGMLGRLMADAPADMQRNDGLRISVTGGQLPLATVQQVKARLTSQLVSALGSTEAGAWATTPLDSADDVRWHRLNPARVVEVVDEAHRVLPPGELGQVRVKLGPGFTGYLNDPETTAEFVRDGYFYPGDLGVLDGAGRLALYGRTTEVISLMGDKIPAAPFEEALQNALGLEGVCILSEQDAAGVEQLHVVLETEAPIDEALLSEAAQANLKGFPRANFHFISPLPRTETGKIQRFKLKQLLLRRQTGR